MASSIIETLSDHQKEQLDIFLKILIEENDKLNITRITSPEQVRIRHFEDSLAPLAMLKEYAQNTDLMPSLVDIGSGGGFPGLVLAIALPDWNIVSVEATGKKADFQYKVVEEAGITNAEVINDRAEELAQEEEYREMYDFAVNRAVGNVSLIAELTGAFVRQGGYFLSYKGPKADEELISGMKALKILGFGDVEQVPYANFGEDGTDFRIVRAQKLKSTPKKYPREFRLIKNKPLGR